MLKKCGSIRAWHFAHDYRYANDYQKNCSYETYLHGYAKRRLKEWFDESNSIILHYQQSIVCKSHETCEYFKDRHCRKNTRKSYDLKLLFNRCTIEAPIREANGNYRADLLLTSDENPSRRILLEIKVSHGCTEKKKTSNAQIIEFYISSEEDVEYIITHDIKKSDKVRFYGFKNNIKQDEKGIIKPLFSWQKFILYKSGKPYCKECDCQTITKRHQKSLLEITVSISEDDVRLLYLYGLMQAKKQGLDVRNCYLCKHQCYSKEKECYECKLNDKEIEKGANAIKCQSYIFNSTIKDKLTNRDITIIDMYIGKV